MHENSRQGKNYNRKDTQSLCDSSTNLSLQNKYYITCIRKYKKQVKLFCMCMVYVHEHCVRNNVYTYSTRLAAQPHMIVIHHYISYKNITFVWDVLNV